MEPVYWYAIAYTVGTIFGFWIGSRYGIGKGIAVTLEVLVEGGYVKSRTDENGDLDLLKLSFKDKLDASSNAKTKTN